MAFLQDKLSANGNVWQVVFPNGEYYTATYLSFRDYQLYRYLFESTPLPDSFINTELCRRVIISPEIVSSREDEMLAGIYSTIAMLSMQFGTNYHSTVAEDGVECFQQLLEYARNNAANSIDEHIYATICSTFSGYTYEALDKLRYPQILRLFASAETFLVKTGHMQEYSAIISADDSEEKKPQAKRPQPLVRPEEATGGLQFDEIDLSQSSGSDRTTNKQGERSIERASSVIEKGKKLVIPMSEIKKMNAQMSSGEVLEAEKEVRDLQETYISRLKRAKEQRSTGEWRDYNYIEPNKLKAGVAKFNQQVSNVKENRKPRRPKRRKK